MRTQSLAAALVLLALMGCGGKDVAHAGTADLPDAAGLLPDAGGEAGAVCSAFCGRFASLTCPGSFTPATCPGECALAYQRSPNCTDQLNRALHCLLNEPITCATLSSGDTVCPAETQALVMCTAKGGP